MSGRNPAAILYDAEGNEVRVVEVGRSSSLFTRNVRQEKLLEEILRQLKKMNVYLSALRNEYDVDLDDIDTSEGHK